MNLSTTPGRLVLAAFFSAVSMMFAAASQAADVFVTFDEQGDAHFAPTPLDERYRLLFKDVFSAGRTANAGRVEPPEDIKVVLERAASRHGLDYSLLYAVAEAESGFDVGAVSPKGAIGLMQVMPDTASRYGVMGETPAALRTNLRQLHVNVEVGSRYLSDLLKRFGGRTELAVAAYNAGEGAVQRSGNRIPSYDETRNYVGRVMQTYQRKQAGGSGASSLLQGGSLQRIITAPAPRALRSTPGSVQVFMGSTMEIKHFERNFGMAR